MPDTEKTHKVNHKIVIYHGHIHVLSMEDKNKDNKDLNNSEIPEF